MNTERRRTSARVAAALAVVARVAAALAVVALMIGAFTVGLGARAAMAAKVGAGAVRLTIIDVRPNSPALINSPPQPLAISLSLTNTTGQPLRDVTVSAARGDPIASQQKLDEAIAKPKAPSPALEAPLKTTLTVTLAPYVTLGMIYRTTTDIAPDAGLCLCANAIYPLYFTAVYAPPNGIAVQLGAAQTYLPSFTAQPAKARVSWLWPLLDRPHRLTSDTVFTDDDLAAEVSSGGRLDRLLTVVEQVEQSVSMTLITDPDLIDELAVMSQGYLVATSKGNVRGTGGDAAAAWLLRLRSAIGHRGMELGFTAAADPAVESLNRNGLRWSVRLGTGEQARISAVLGGQMPLSDIAWPAGGTLSKSTLSALVAQGAKTVVLSDRVLPRGAGSGAGNGAGAGTVVADALAPVQTKAGEAIAAITSTPVQRWVTAALAPVGDGPPPEGKGLSALPKLVAEVALRVVNSLDRSSYLVITPPRNLSIDDPSVAVRVILATARTPWSRSLPLRHAASTLAPVDHGPLRSGRVRAPVLPGATLDSVRYVTDSLPGLADLYVAPRVANAAYAAAAAELAALPVAIQRCESTSLLVVNSNSVAFSAQLESRIRDGILNKVNLVQPRGGAGRTTGTYTLTSTNSRLPITIVNALDVEVRVRLAVGIASGAPGLHAQDVERTINANTTVQVKVPTHVDRVGRFTDVRATLSTTDGLPLGRPIEFTVRSTALGTIGVVITIVAGLVLALALVVRFIRRMSKPRRPKSVAPASAATSSA